MKPAGALTVVIGVALALVGVFAATQAETRPVVLSYPAVLTHTVVSAWRTITTTEVSAIPLVDQYVSTFEVTNTYVIPVSYVVLVPVTGKTETRTYTATKFAVAYSSTTVDDTVLIYEIMYATIIVTAAPTVPLYSTKTILSEAYTATRLTTTTSYLTSTSYSLSRWAAGTEYRTSYFETIGTAYSTSQQTYYPSTGVGIVVGAFAIVLVVLGVWLRMTYEIDKGRKEEPL